MPPLQLERLAEVPPAARADIIERLSDGARAELRLEAVVVRTENEFKPRGAAAELRDLTDPEILLSGPAGTGKSIGILMHLFSLACHNPGMRALMVRKTAASLTASGLVTWRTKVVDRAMAAGAVEYYGGSAEEPPQYRFWNGSKIMIGGMDNAAKVMSTEYDFIFVQEAIELNEADWEALTTRLRNGVLANMQIVGDTNPDTPTHWLKARCDRGTTVMLESRHEDNPVLVHPDGGFTEFGATYIGRLDRLTGVRHARLRKGLWVAAEGMIYEHFDPAIHVVDNFAVPDSWPRYWAIDFGYTNPFVCQWWAEDPDGRLYLYREIYRTGTLVADHAAAMLNAVTRPGPDGRLYWTEPKPQAVICDHDAEGRAQLKAALKMGTRAAKKDVLPGIEATMLRMRPAGDGRPRLLFMRDTLIERDQQLADEMLPTKTIEEIPAYIWQPPSAGRAPKEEPLKANDHGCDAMRYLVMDRDKGRPTIRHFG